MQHTVGRGRRQAGMAMFIVTIVLAMMGALVVMAMSQSGEELAASGRTRAGARALYAADAGIEIARKRIAENPPDTNAIDLALPSGWAVQSRTRIDAAALPLALDGSYGPPPEGYSLDEGFSSEIYRVNITASAAGLGVAELEAKISRLAASPGAY